MELIKAVVLGIIQGLTEYLPVSSSAHLRIFPALVGWPDPGAAYTAVIQIGTLCAVLIYFAKDLGAAISAWARSITDKDVRKTPAAKLGWAVFVGTLPIIFFGLAFKKPIESTLRSLYVIATSMIAMAVVLLVAELLGRRVRKIEDARPMDGLWVGLWQCVALIPGASRSGSTITGSLFLGFDRATAARFSFLLSVPSVLAAAVFELYKWRHDLLGAGLPAVVVGNVFSFIVGYWSIAFLMRFLQTRSVGVFVVYRLALGALLFGLLASGRLEPMAGAEEVQHGGASASNAPARILRPLQGPVSLVPLSRDLRPATTPFDPSGVGFAAPASGVAGFGGGHEHPASTANSGRACS